MSENGGLWWKGRYYRVNEDHSLVEMAVDVPCYWEAESWKKEGRGGHCLCEYPREKIPCRECLEEQQ